MGYHTQLFPPLNSNNNYAGFLENFDLLVTHITPSPAYGKSNGRIEREREFEKQNLFFTMFQLT